MLRAELEFYFLKLKFDFVIGVDDDLKVKSSSVVDNFMGLLMG